MGLHYQSLCITSKTATLTADDDAQISTTLNLMESYWWLLNC